MATRRLTEVDGHLFGFELVGDEPETVRHFGPATHGSPTQRAATDWLNDAPEPSDESADYFVASYGGRP